MNIAAAESEIKDPCHETTYEGLLGEESVKDEELEADAKLRAHDLFTRLQGTFSSPSYITLEEVRDATGFDGQRTADAMAISLYRSRGKAVYGFEFKISRSDWLHELKQPEKSESILRYCDYWALVVPNKDIVKPGELPPTWGMYVAQKNRLKCLVPCPKLDPLPMSRIMLTALLYAVDHRQSKIDESALRKARDEGYASGVSSSKDGHYERMHKELLDRVQEFEKASGLNINYGWKLDKVGEAVRVLMEGNSSIRALLSQARCGVESAERLKKELEDHVQILESIIPPDTKEKEDQ